MRFQCTHINVDYHWPHGRTGRCRKNFRRSSHAADKRIDQLRVDHRHTSVAEISEQNQVFIRRCGRLFPSERRPSWCFLVTFPLPSTCLWRSFILHSYFGKEHRSVPVERGLDRLFRLRQMSRSDVFQRKCFVVWVGWYGRQGRRHNPCSRHHSCLPGIKFEYSNSVTILFFMQFLK